MAGDDDALPPALQAQRYWESEAYLFACDLYNYGYFWEAHEGWEGLWHALGRRGLVADIVRYLILATAAHVKVRQRSLAGVRSLSRRAIDGIDDAAALTGGPFMGIDLDDFARRMRAYFEPARGGHYPDPTAKDVGFPYLCLDMP